MNHVMQTLKNIHRIFFMLACLLGMVSMSYSQILEPVKWKTFVEKISDDEYRLKIVAQIDKGWHLYAQEVPDGGPIPTTFTFEKNAAYQLIGAVEEEIGKTVDDPVFEMRIKFFEKKAVFSQKIKMKDVLDSIYGNVSFMVCDDARCLPPTDRSLTFLMQAPNVNADAESQQKPEVKKEIDSDATNKKLYGFAISDLTGFDKNSSSNVSEASTINSEEENGSSFLSILGLGFLGGLLALLTPCVFPMIPLTVSFFTKQEEKSGNAFFKAFIYGFSILLVYLLLSLPFHLLDSVNPDILNDVSTNAWLNLAFFIIFIFFAFSFFGYYELMLPPSWASKTTKKESLGGFLGIFFMALTLALVSFSCTGPILGSLLVGSLTSIGGAWQLTAGMGGFGLALGLPFAFFALFPNMMNALPKSGGWLNSVKVILGFLELAFAFKFLSNADLVQHWELLKIELFLVIWIIIFAGLALYLFGKIKFLHDAPIRKLGVARIIGGTTATVFVIYLATGFRLDSETKMYTPLKLLSGLTPPVGYSYLHPNTCPNNLSCYKDLKTGLEQARKEQKPILLDFTGYACVNCRKMEEHIWLEKEIDEIIRKNYVLVSLYVDDKKELPYNEKMEVKQTSGGIRKLRNYGHKWAHFQTEFFNTNSQPYYVLINSKDMTVLNKPIGYTPKLEAYKNWLREGIK